MKKIALAMLGVVLMGTTAFAAMNFPDIRSSDWFRAGAEFAFDHNIIRGIEGRFEPGQDVTRAQMAVMMQRYASNVHMAVGPKVYRDNWYGFELTFPQDTWRGYIVETVNPPAGTSDNGLLTTYRFGLVNNSGVFEELMTIGVHTRASWDSVLHIAGSALGTNEQYGIGIGIASNVSPELVAARNAINASIRGSFRFLPMSI